MKTGGRGLFFVVGIIFMLGSLLDFMVGLEQSNGRLAIWKVGCGVRMAER